MAFILCRRLAANCTHVNRCPIGGHLSGGGPSRVFLPKSSGLQRGLCADELEIKSSTRHGPTSLPRRSLHEGRYLGESDLQQLALNAVFAKEDYVFGAENR